MIDLDIEMTEKLCRYEIARAERSGESVNPYCLHHTPAHAMLELITLLRQAEKDAARYQWLRGQGCSDWEVDGVEVPHIEVTMWASYGVDGLNTGESLHGDEMDSAIDCAMNKRDGGDL